MSSAKPNSPNSPRRTGGPYRKPRADIYTVLLAIALVALLLAIVCLYLEMDTYKWEFKGGPSVVVNQLEILGMNLTAEASNRSAGGVPMAFAAVVPVT